MRLRPKSDTIPVPATIHKSTNFVQPNTPMSGAYVHVGLPRVAAETGVDIGPVAAALSGVALRHSVRAITMA
jgi:hypothetical protein